MIVDFVRVFRKSSEEFKSHDAKEKMETLFAILQDEKLLKDVIDEIKSDERSESGGNIFLNVVSLMPFSLKIVEKFLESKFLDDASLYKKLKIIFVTKSKIIDILQSYKRKFKNKNFKSVDLDEKIAEVDKELSKHIQTKKKIDEYEKKKAQLLKNENLDKNLIDIKKEIEEMSIILKEYKKLKKEIEDSKKIFKDLPKDEI